MMSKQALLRDAGLYVVGLFVLLPTLLATLVFAPMGAVTAWAMFIEHHFEAAAKLFAALAGGCSGVRSMWILFLHFRKNTGRPPHTAFHCIALLCGSTVSLLFVIYSGGAIISNLCLFGWPLWGALYFLARLLLSAPHQGMRQPGA